MEIAQWLDRKMGMVPSEVTRIYLGNETCFDRIPPLSDLILISRRLCNEDRQLTLATSPLTEGELNRARFLIEAIAKTLGRFEVVCNDWGLVHWLTEAQVAEPVVGRFLVGQTTDPRLAALTNPERQRPHERDVLHTNGARVGLRYRPPSDDLMAHLRGCAVVAPEALSFLNRLGVRRLEIGNALQGIDMKIDHPWRVTLHLTDVQVAASRHPWHEDGTKWLHPTFPVALHHRDNALFYDNDAMPLNLQELHIDRIVRKAV
jgi:hypothetical protein